MLSDRALLQAGMRDGSNSAAAAACESLRGDLSKLRETVQEMKDSRRSILAEASSLHFPKMKVVHGAHHHHAKASCQVPSRC